MGLKLLALLAACSAASGSAPRRVRISGRAFEVASSGAPIVLAGPNVVVKGPPYLPSTAGDSVCSDVVTDLCAAHGNCSSCTTFTALDAQNFAQRGWNALRLGIVWAGAQPRDEDALDPAFVARLHAVLALTDAHNLTVVLDNHGDMVGSAGCGNGVPMWFQQRAAPELIGAPLATGFPFDLIPSLQVDALVPQACKANASLWRVASGDPQYNLLNPCCREMNAGGNPGALGYTTVSQKSMDYMITPGPGRDAFVRYWRLVAEAVAEHPSASFAELMNEPMTIWREQAFDTWRAAGEAILAVVPDMGISVCVRARALLPAAAAPAHNARPPLIPPPPLPLFLSTAQHGPGRGRAAARLAQQHHRRQRRHFASHTLLDQAQRQRVLRVALVLCARHGSRGRGVRAGAGGRVGHSHVCHRVHGLRSVEGSSGSGHQPPVLALLCVLQHWRQLCQHAHARHLWRVHPGLGGGNVQLHVQLIEWSGGEVARARH